MLRINFRINMSIDLQDVRPTIIVVIKEAAAHATYWLMMPTPDSNAASVKVPSPLLWYRLQVSSAKLVLKMSNQPSQS